MINKIRETFIVDLLKELELIENALKMKTLDDTFSEVVSSIFTATHNIKGAGPMLGFTFLGEIIKPIELVYKTIKNGDLSMSEEIRLNTLKFLPIIREELASDSSSKEPSSETKSLMNFFESLYYKKDRE